MSRFGELYQNRGTIDAFRKYCNHVETADSQLHIKELTRVMRYDVPTRRCKYSFKLFKIPENKCWYVTEGRRCKSWNSKKFVTHDSARKFWDLVACTVDVAFALCMENVFRDCNGHEGQLLEMSYGNRGLGSLKKQELLQILAPIARSNKLFISDLLQK